MFIKKFASLLIVLFTIAIIGCSENPTIVNDNNKQIPTSIQQPCGTPVNYNFFINKTTLAGIITVSNDETNLFITYTLNSPYLIPPGGAHVWLGSSAPTGKGAPGQYPYHSDNTTYVSTYTFTIPLTDLQQYLVNGTFYFMTHSAVVVQNQDGSYGSEATGYSEHIVIPQRGAWYGYNSYTWQECGGGGGQGGPEKSDRSHVVL